MTNSRAKGKRGELLLRDELRKFGWADARRGQQFCGGPDSPDVMCGPAGWHIEVKFAEQQRPWEAMTQSEADCDVGEIPMVAMKRKNKQWLAVLKLGDLLTLLKEREVYIQKRHLTETAATQPLTENA